MLVVVTAAMLVAYFPLPADDAYIVARYADQLHRGNGLVFNVGERVNALTSPLLTWVAVTLRSIGDAPTTLYRGAAAILVVWTLLAIARKRYDGPAQQLLFLALTLASPFVCFWTVAGLETPMLLCACTALTYCALTLDATNAARRAAQIIGLAAVAVLLRYDSALFVGPIAALCLYQHWRRSPVTAVAIAAAGVIGAWLAFTYFYYGDVLPTSFYVKLGNVTTSETLGRGAGYAVSFLVLSLLAFMAIAGGFRWRERARVHWIAVALWGGLLLQLTYALVAGTQHMMYAYRLFVPYLPASVLLLMPPDRRPMTMHSATRRGLLAMVVIAYQATIGLLFFYKSENPNLSLLLWRQDVGQQVYELSTVGARNTKNFLQAVQGSAKDIEAHWVGLPVAKERPMRIVALTGGMLPYLLPTAYVYEALVSYRRQCNLDPRPAADYMQVIHSEANPKSPAELFGENAGSWTLISKHVIKATGLEFKPYGLRVDIWYNRAPQPLMLSSRIDLPC
jgi:hypothetical protein